MPRADQEAADASVPEPGLIGRAVERIEDASLLRGLGRYADDLGVRPGTLHAAILRSPHAHAEILAIDTAAALAMPGVRTVLTRDDVTAWSQPFTVGVKQPMEHWCLAVDRVRYVGEPVAIVVAEDRYRAEDALDAIAVTYRELPCVVDAVRAEAADAPVLHSKVGSNLVSDRHFVYGDPEAAFAATPRRVALDVRYPRNAGTPIECFVVVAEYAAADNIYDVLANFQGPFALHPVMALALKVPGNRLRLRAPRDSGGSFGVKQAIFPYIVAMALAARKVGQPVKWVEDRLEHLTAATSATGRDSHIEAAVEADGRIRALRLTQTDDCGAYLRAPEPATLYRMHGNLTGAYAIPHLEARSRVVLTNKTPTGLNRGFGGSQLYYAIERLMQRIAVELGLDPLEVIRRNLVPVEAMPYRTASGALHDAGDYLATLEEGVREGNLAELLARRDRARAEGRLYGIGYAAVVEPSVSNMGYITTVLTPEERRRAGAKDGAQASATVAIDPLGAVTVTVASVPQGQGHRTVLAQVVGEALGLEPIQIVVNTELDTQKDAWSIAAGNYSSRFAAAVAGTAHIAAQRLREKLARIAAARLNVTAEQVRFAHGKVFAAGNPDNAIPFHRIAGLSHWSPGSLPEGAAPALRETAFWTPPHLKAPDEGDRIDSSGAYGFIFDFCGVEIDRDTGRVHIDRYVTMHDAGRILNPALVDGQIRGGFAHAVGAALLEEFTYGEDGSFQSGTLVDYLVPTACEVPDPIILHRETISPLTPLGAKGVGEGNCMSTPVCLANAVADALGIKDVAIPLTPARVAELVFVAEPPAPPRTAPAAPRAPKLKAGTGGRALTGEGASIVPAPPEQVWQMLIDPDTLAGVVPGCEHLTTTGPNAYRADVTMRVGPVRGTFTAEVALSDLDPPHALTLSGIGNGPLGTARGEGRVTLEAVPEGTRIAYAYAAEIGGKVAAIGGRMLDGAARIVIGQFFEALAAKAGGKAPGGITALIRRLLRTLGIGG